MTISLAVSGEAPPRCQTIPSFPTDLCYSIRPRYRWRLSRSRSIFSRIHSKRSRLHRDRECPPMDLMPPLPFTALTIDVRPAFPSHSLMPQNYNAGQVDVLSWVATLDSKSEEMGRLASLPAAADGKSQNRWREWMIWSNESKGPEGMNDR